MTKLSQDFLPNNFILADVEIPHEFQFDNQEKFLTTMYKAYIDSFDYHVWYPHIEHLDHVPKNVKLIPITTEHKKVFVEIFDYHTDIKDYDFSDLKINDGNYFIRMSSTSGKMRNLLRNLLMLMILLNI